MQVPLAALYDAGKGPGVWRISAQPARVAWQPVKVLSVGEAAQVTGEVKPGEKIVALGGIFCTRARLSAWPATGYGPDGG